MACSSPSLLLLSRRQPLCVPRCLIGCLSAPWLVAVGCGIVLLALSGVLNAIAAAVVDAPAAVRVALRLQPPLRSYLRSAETEAAADP